MSDTPKTQQGEAEALERPRVAALDEILGRTIPVLDDGFVRVVDYMGSDESIVQAARVSYGKGTKATSEDRNLIRYLMRHRHTTPFEMCEIKFHVRVPMDCWRQWIRHRTACLAEGTEVYFDLPGGISRRGNQLYKVTVEELWKRFQPTQNVHRPDKQKNPFFRRDRVREMRLRQMNEDTLRVQHTRVVDVYRNGVKPVFRVTLEDGKSIEATADHRFLFADGWSTLREATGLREQNGLAVWDRGDQRMHVNGLVMEAPALYQDREWLDEQYNTRKRRIEDIAADCGVSYHTIRKWLRAHGIQHEKGGRSKEPWNKGATYRLGPRDASEEFLESNRKARSGPALARDERNLTTLCGACHRSIAGRELNFVEELGGPPVVSEWKKRPRVAWNKLTVARLVRIDRIEYVGERMTYDLEVEGPFHNFIANGVVTHNSVNEYSTRYSIAIDEAQQTPPGEWRVQSKSSKQGSEGFLDEEAGAALTREEADLQARLRDVYESRLEKGVAREQARKDLPLSTYTEAYWKIDLHNLLHFLALRMDMHAQQEIRDYANAMGEVVAKWCPIAWEAFQDYRRSSMGFTGLEIPVLEAIVNNDAAKASAVAAEHGWLKESKSGKLMRNRERNEFEEKLSRLGLAVPWR